MLCQDMPSQSPQAYDGPGGPLQVQLDEYLGGVSMRDRRGLREWVGALKLIRLAERETEA